MREHLWNDVENACPDMLQRHLKCMNNLDKCIFMLNGLNSQYIDEWQDIYVTFAVFVYKMHKQCDKELMI